MRRLSLRRPSPATTISLIALFVALGGTAYAALPSGSVGTAQLKNGAVTAPKLARAAVTPAKLSARTEWATVGDSGQIIASSGGITATRASAGNYYVKFPESELGHGLAVTWLGGGLDIGTVTAAICTSTFQGVTCNSPEGTDARYVYVETAGASGPEDNGFYIVSTP